MNKEMDLRTARLLGCGFSTCFLLFHIVLILLFKHYGVTPMVRFNLFSIVFYLSTYVMLLKNRLWIYVVLTYFEVELHMTLGICFVGLNCGFQIAMIGLNILLFYTDYLSGSLKRRRLPTIRLSLLGFALFVGASLFSHRFGARYVLPPDVCFWMELAWGVTVCGLGIMILKLLVTLASRSEALLSDKATHDPLTGLYNRAGYEQRLSGLDVGATVLLLLDADRFKPINDNYGHDTGDRILKKIADSLRRNFRAEDCLCRIGGDEFAVLMHSPEGLREELTVERVRDINTLLADTSDGLPAASVSVGAAFGGEAGDMDRLFEHADAALYERKREGRGGCSFYRKNKG